MAKIDDVGNTPVNLYADQGFSVANIRNVIPMSGVYANNIITSSSNENVYIVQIGAGGTGGYTAVKLMRFIGNLPDAVKGNIKYTIVDGDVFEPKNLARQLCTDEDMGINKATSIVNNYGPFFDINPENLTAYPNYINSVEDLSDICTGFRQDAGRSSLIIIDCVDKNLPRNVIYDFVNSISIKQSLSYKAVYVVSSGNGKFAGQVCWGRRILCDLKRLTISTGNYLYNSEGGETHVSPDVLLRMVEEGTSFSIFSKASDFANLSAYKTRFEKAEELSNGEGFTSTYLLDRGNFPIIDLQINGEDHYKVKLRKSPQYENNLSYVGTFCDVKLPYDRFPELLDLEVDAREEAMSCAERAVANVQSLYANETAACFITNYVTAILGMVFPVDADVPSPIRSVVSSFDVSTNMYSSTPLLFKELVE